MQVTWNATSFRPDRTALRGRYHSYGIDVLFSPVRKQRAFFLNNLHERNTMQARRREASQRGGTGTASPPSVTACLRCREQKV